MGSGVGRVLGDPLVLLAIVSFVSIVVVVGILYAGSRASYTENVEEWVVREDPNTGELRVVVHRKVKRR